MALCFPRHVISHACLLAWWVNCPALQDIRRGIHQRELYKQRIAEIEAEDARRRFQESTGGGRGSGGFTHQLPGSGKAGE